VYLDPIVPSGISVRHVFKDSLEIALKPHIINTAHNGLIVKPVKSIDKSARSGYEKGA